MADMEKRRLLGEDECDDHEFDNGSSRVIPTRRKITVEPVLFLYYLAYKANAPMTSQLVVELLSNDYSDRMNLTTGFGDESNCNTDPDDPSFQFQQFIQGEASTLITWLQMATAIPAVFVTFLLGAYSDRAGRKASMLLPPIGGALRAIVFLVVTWLDVSPYFLIIGAFVDGLTGWFATAVCLCNAYISDVTSTSQRTFRLTVLQMAINVANAGGQLGMGFLIRETGFIVPLFVILVIHIINFLYILCFVQETIAKKTSARISFKYIIKVFHVFIPTRKRKKSISSAFSDHKRHIKLAILLFIYYVNGVTHEGKNDIQNLYMLNAPLCWNSVMIGFWESAYAFLSGMGGLVVVRIMQRWFSDAWMIISQLTFAIGTKVTLAFAYTTAVMFIVPVIAIGQSMDIPLVNSMMSKLVEPNERGSLFSLVACAQALCLLSGSVIFNNIYSATLYFMNGFVFLVMAFVYFCGALITFIYIQLDKHWANAERERAEKAALDQAAYYSKSSVEDRSIMCLSESEAMVLNSSSMSYSEYLSDHSSHKTV